MSCRIGDHRIRDRVPDGSKDGQACNCGKYVLRGGQWVSSGRQLAGR